VLHVCDDTQQAPNMSSCALWVPLQVSGWQGARELHSDHGSVVVYRGMTDCFVRTGETILAAGGC
jgi:hypothetical protein